MSLPAPPDPEKRAEAMQAEFDRLLALVSSRELKPRPIAKLQVITRCA